MCGIFGYVGKRNAVEIALEGLKKLEYRGYDSAGIAGIENGDVRYCKEVGKISTLEQLLAADPLNFTTAIAQTRWATHGQPSRLNAHPHLDERASLALVHNGIIENYAELRHGLKLQGIQFISDTDSEVIAHLLAHHYHGDMKDALCKVMSQLQGAYALAIVHKDYPSAIFAVTHEAPLAIGIGKDELFLASDSNAFLEHTTEVLFLGNGEVAHLTSEGCQLFDALMSPVERQPERIPRELADSSKGNYEHYTLKEIHEQPQAIRRAMAGRLQEEYTTAHFVEIENSTIDLLSIERIIILACGSSLYAGAIAAYMIEDNARIPVQVEISSEYRYKNPIVQPGTLAIAISQSGETADTLAAMRELKAKGAKVLAICNVQNSAIVREADSSILLQAGPEIGVCSTKAFTCQLVLLSLLALLLARMRYLPKQNGQLFLQALKNLPEQVQQVLDKAHHIHQIAKRYCHYENFFFIGRRHMFPTSLEGALKLKEISYINANGYPAGEMKHGPIALISPDCPTVALCANLSTFDKLQSNLMEIKARKGPIIAIASQGQSSIIVDDVIYVPNTIDELAPILTAVAAQLLAYYIAKERGTEIDQPRNLAKSVTVE
jgi:glucosamine--fructose-6-phosphate aminotransferase (isomerizing)